MSRSKHSINVNSTMARMIINLMESGSKKMSTAVQNISYVTYKKRH